MSQRIAILTFLIAVILDLFLSSLFGYPAWFPYFSLSVMPAIVMFGEKKSSWLVTAMQSLFLWLFSGINLGIAVFATGILIILFKDVVKNLFHTTTWQAAAATSCALIFSLFLLATLSNLIADQSVFTTKFFIGVSSTAILSFIISLVVQRRYVHSL